jgi:hypothetical protein
MKYSTKYIKEKKKEKKKKAITAGDTKLLSADCCSEGNLKIARRIITVTVNNHYLQLTYCYQVEVKQLFPPLFFVVVSDQFGFLLRYFVPQKSEMFLPYKRERRAFLVV